ncbi:MAG: hypothetical protein J2P23_00460 [Microlunatus sp.]|nr:hypothetical protein [Microlunatus sp.]
MRFGRRKASTGSADDPPGPARAAEAGGLRQIQVFDAYGRQYTIDAEVWRTQVLPDALRQHWYSPDELAGDITMALRDGYAADVVAAAERLGDLEPPGTERSAVLLAGCLIAVGDLARADAVLRDLLAVRNSAPAWTNLAKIASASGRTDAVVDSLERALEADPNDDDALMWLGTIRREEAGEAGWRDVLDTTARRDGAWRPQLWLGRAALEDGDKHDAIAWYRQAMDRAPDQPAALRMVSGDLGKAGLLDDLLASCLPRWRPEVHGVDAGRNLLEGALRAERIPEAEDILHRLHLLQLPNLVTELRPYEDRLDHLRSRRLAAVPENDAPLSVTVLESTDPIWWRPLAEPEWVLGPAQQPTLVGLTQLWAPQTGDRLSSQRTAWRGRVSRGTPWYLADLLRQNGIGALVAMPVLAGQGMMLTGARDSDDQLRRLFGHPDHPATLIVTGSVGGSEAIPTVTLEFLDAQSLSPVLPAQPEVLLGDLSQYVSETLTALGTPCSPRWVPSEAAAAPSISGYEALVSLVVLAQGLMPADAYWAERGTLNFLLELASSAEGGDSACFGYLAALAANTGRGSNIHAEFENRTGLLLERAPAGTPRDRLRPLVDALFDRPVGPATGEPAYDAWLARLGNRSWYPAG